MNGNSRASLETVLGFKIPVLYLGYPLQIYSTEMEYQECIEAFRKIVYFKKVVLLIKIGVWSVDRYDV
ncbi:MAG: hypothetical protein ABEJ99_05025 [Candidatus Nanohaloarchaea archaeon]